MQTSSGAPKVGQRATKAPGEAGGSITSSTLREPSSMTQDQSSDHQVRPICPSSTVKYSYVMQTNHATGEASHEYIIFQVLDDGSLHYHGVYDRVWKASAGTIVHAMISPGARGRPARAPSNVDPRIHPGNGFSVVPYTPPQYGLPRGDRC